MIIFRDFLSLEEEEEEEDEEENIPQQVTFTFLFRSRRAGSV